MVFTAANNAFFFAFILFVQTCIPKHTFRFFSLFLPQCFLNSGPVMYGPCLCFKVALVLKVGKKFNFYDPVHFLYDTIHLISILLKNQSI